MKKQILAALSLVAIFSSTVFAATIAPADADAGKTVLGDNKQLGKLSNAVKLGANYDTTGYAIATSHLKGAKTFGTSHNATNIYAVETLQTAAPTATDSSAFSTWTAM